jgi:hypothetical protein
MLDLVFCRICCLFIAVAFIAAVASATSLLIVSTYCNCRERESVCVCVCLHAHTYPHAHHIYWYLSQSDGIGKENNFQLYRLLLLITFEPMNECTQFY